MRLNFHFLIFHKLGVCAGIGTVSFKRPFAGFHRARPSTTLDKVIITFNFQFEIIQSIGKKININFS